MEAEKRNGRNAFIRDLMHDVAPSEVPLVDDYIAAIDAPQAGSLDGMEFGIEDLVSAIGPLVVVAGAALYANLSKWAIESAADVIKRYIKLGGEKVLFLWMDRPKKGGLSDALTPEGKHQLLTLVRSSFSGKKIPKDKIDRVIAALERRLFDPE